MTMRKNIVYKPWLFLALLGLASCNGITPKLPLATPLPGQTATNAPSLVSPTPGPGSQPTDTPVPEIPFPSASALNYEEWQQLEKSQLGRSNNQFAFKLMESVYKEKPKENIFISPLSIHLLLTLLLNGANGETKQQLAQVLELDPLAQEKVNADLPLFQRHLSSKTERDVFLRIANSLWIQPNYTFKPTFTDLAKRSYSADLFNLDFASPTAAKTMNRWVRERTGNRIKDLIDQPSLQDAISVLINTLYFKAPWYFPFEAKYTKSHPFKLLNGSQKLHPLMFIGQDRFSQPGYLDDKENKVQLTDLSYLDPNLSMLLFLPYPDSSLAELMEKMNLNYWNKILTRPSVKRNGDLYLPKFSFSYKENLNQRLQQLGAHHIFSDKADFSNMLHTSVSISKVEHQTFIKVTEKGTEAAAATTAYSLPSAVQDGPFEMKVDRPFFFVIYDSTTKVILFMGTVVDPVE